METLKSEKFCGKVFLLLLATAAINAQVKSDVRTCIIYLCAIPCSAACRTNILYNVINAHSASYVHVHVYVLVRIAAVVKIHAVNVFIATGSAHSTARNPEK